MTVRLRAIAFAASALALGFAAPGHAALEITNVSHAPAAIDSTKRQSVEIRFRISEPARVTLRIFDGRDLMVRGIPSAKILAAGDQRLSWDGRDAKGQPVPPEAYVYTLTATPGGGAPVEHDLTDLSGNEEIAPPTVRWDSAKHLVRYELAAPARLKIRTGLANGPLLKTVIDGVARAAGPHAEPWDGKDESGLIDAAKNPDLQLSAQAWSLSKNAIVVLPDPEGRTDRDARRA